MAKEFYKLYVGNNCKSCDKIEFFLNQHHINIITINIDEEDYQLPFSLVIIPALVKNEKLIAYGPDIIKHFDV